ncbi:Gfo/Idh/MocA family oxidoreductase [Pelagibacteraceae bacterium]|nr:Gfo/Idh/MocA family oxidoreductase [Pelagibacteraceae bacterium]
MNIGLIGCGNISDTYFQSQNIFNNLKIVACADIFQELADKKANQYNIKSLSVENLLNNKDIDIVLNLTIPSAHKKIILKSMENGKHCFSEKPLAMSFKEGLEIKELSNNKKLFVGCAPDTFLGAAGQKARSLIENNSIGNVVLGTFNVMSHGMEDWHPNPDFFFKPGGGPVFDLGVYYLTQLVNLNGPIRSVIATNATASDERIITSKPRYGEKILVETPTTLMGTLEFYNNSKFQFLCSWDIWKHTHTNMELYGDKGSMIIPDPNFFSGDILISNKNNEWEKINNNKMLLGIPNKTDNNGTKIANYRGIGLSDMINSIENNRDFRCSLELSLHILEIMESIIISANDNKQVNIITKPKQPNPLNDDEILSLKQK